MNVLELAAGVLFVLWPPVYRRQLARIRDQAAARGADTGRFDRAMGRPVMRVLPVVAPIVGVLLIIAGITGG